MLVKRKLLQLVFIVTLALSVVAQQKPASDATAPSVERLRSHVTYLASDKLQGRRTGTRGADAAAEYIAREFGRYGLKRTNGIDRPGMSILEADSPNRYMQQFPYVAGVEPGKGNTLVAMSGTTPITLRPVEDWLPLGFSSNGQMENAPAVYVNYGIAAKELNRDDYAQADVKGKVVIALDGTPDGDNPHGQFARYTDPRWKVIAARDRGAKALILLSTKEKFADDPLSNLRVDSAGEAGLPVIVLGKPAASRIIRTANSPKEFEKFTWSLSTDIVRRESPAANVVGIIEGSDSQLKNEAIVIGAHYDHLGTGGEGSLATREGEIHHGADDNASGVAGLLELARIFSSQSTRPRHTLVFIAFSGEEEGLLGSNYYVNHPIVPLANTIAMLNMDMIGRMKDKRLLIGGAGTAAEWRDWINAANYLKNANTKATNSASTASNAAMQPQANVVAADASKPQSAPSAGGANGAQFIAMNPATKFEITLNEDGFGPSDHSSFYAKQVPVLFFFTGSHDDYHKPSDTADKIDYESEAGVVALISSIIRSIDASDKRPTYAVAKSDGSRRSASFRVTLGVVPNYAESTDGMKIDGVRDDSPAAKAGLLAGDKVTKLGGHAVKNVYDYTYALGEMKAGEEYEIEVVREGQTLKFKITPAARKQ